MNDPTKDLSALTELMPGPSPEARERLRARLETLIEAEPAGSHPSRGHRWRPWTQGAVIVAVAAAALAVLFIPLAHASLFRHAVRPGKQPPPVTTLRKTPPIGAQPDQLAAVSCTSATACTAVGSYGGLTVAEAWNGTKWSVEPTANPTGSKGSSLAGVSCTSATACTAVGGYDNGDGTYATLAEAWNGKSWVVEPTPNPRSSKGTHILVLSLSGISCTSAAACTAVGGYDNSAANDLTLAESWNGKKWKIEPTPNVSGASLSAVSCTSVAACTAVGGFGPNGFAGPRMELWNGRTWAIAYGDTDATGTPPFGGVEFLGVSCTSTTECIVVGSRSPFGMLAEVWNGKSLTFEPSAADGVSLLGVSCTSATTCTAVGSYDITANTQSTLAEAWNGRKWTVETTPKAP
jgi:hypothetical protein